MSAVLLLLATPVIAALLLAAVPVYRAAAAINVAASALTLFAALAVALHRPAPNAWLMVDDLNVWLIVLSAFVAFTSSLFSATSIREDVAAGRIRPPDLRFYHALFQAFVFTVLLGFSANNLGLMWVAVEGATLATAPMVALNRTPASVRAAWTYMVLCGVGIALALFGTILVYLAAQPVAGPGVPSMTFTVLVHAAAGMSPAVLNLAFVFVLVGYGTKVGLAPMQAWVPDAYAEGPAAISAILSGLLPNLALYAVLRFKMLMAGNPGTHMPGPLMLVMGFASVLLAAAMLYRKRDIKRLFAYSSVEHMGIATLAFGIGGPLANLGGLLHMAVHSLAKSGVFFAVGPITHDLGTRRIGRPDGITGLLAIDPALGAGLLLAVAVLVGLPPFGLFTSEVLILTAAAHRAPWLAVALAATLALGVAALMLHLHRMAFGPPPSTGAAVEPAARPRLALAVLGAHLALAALAGLHLPVPVAGWFGAVARALG